MPIYLRISRGEVVNTTVHLINQCPSAALDFKVPEEIWSGMPPDYSHLRIFGCVTYAYVSQGKLEPRVKRCMFVGYPSGVKGWKLWYKEGGISRTLISRDVVFKEDEMFMKIDDQLAENAQEGQVQMETVE